MISRSLILVVLSCALHGEMLRAQDDAVADFKAKALSEWATFPEKITSVRGEATYEAFTSKDHQPLRLTNRQYSKYGFRRDTGMFGDLEMEFFDEKGKSMGKDHMLTISNPHYSAELFWKKGTEGWLLRNLKMESDGDYHKALRDAQEIPWLRICDTVSVPKLIQDPGFVILSIQQLAGSAGSKPLRVQFRNDGWQQQGTIPIQYVQSGFIDFDAGHSYRIMRYEVHWKEKNSEGDRKGVMEYEEGEGIPMLKTMVQEWPEQHSKKRGLISSKSTASRKYSYNSGPSEEEFRLSYYGLPEPKEAPPLKRSHNWLWLLAAAIGFAALAMLFAWLKRRRRAAAQAKTQILSPRSLS